MGPRPAYTSKQRKAGEESRAKNTRAKNARESSGKIQQIQQTYGNQGVQRLVSELAQSEPKKRSATDEREADRVAEQVTGWSRPASRRQQGQTGTIRERGTADPLAIASYLRPSGRALDSQTRRAMETRIGHDLSPVRVHTDSRAAAVVQALDARALTVGNAVAFAQGQYKPQTPEGRRLLAHELAHTVQQRTGQPKIQRENGMEASPQQQPWAHLLQKGREGLTLEISNKFDLIRTKKSQIARTWRDNAKKVEQKPGEIVLEVALGIVSAGLAKVMGGIVSRAVKKVITNAKVENLVTGVSDKVIGDSLGKVSKLLKEAMTKREPGELKENAKQGIANSSKTGLVDYFRTGFDNMLLSEYQAKHSVFTDNVTSMSDEELAILLHTLNVTVEELNADNAPILQQLTIGYMTLLDEIFIEGRSKEYAGETSEARRKRMYKKDPTIDETGQRSGSMLIVGPISSIGTWQSPSFSIRAGITTGLNEETRETLKGARIRDLPFTLSFRFWGSMVKRSIFGGGHMVKIWFVKRADGTIAVDLDESWESDGDDLEDGREWLALYGLRGPLEPMEPLADDLVKRNVAKGGRKVYEQIKDMKIPRVIDTDLF